MSRPARALLRRTLLRRTVATLSGGAVAAAALVAVSVSADSAATDAGVVPVAADTVGNVVTPGDFTGYGFDQCLTPDQQKMNTWLEHSPFLAVGIYISGDSRACRDQPNLTPTWVRKQLANGWRLLPITLGPQASCQPRFPRYHDDKTIVPKPGPKDRYPKARKQGSVEAASAVAAASALGIVAGSTLWYDLEGFDLRNTRCRESALAFLSALDGPDPQAGLRLRRLLQRRLGHQDARRRAGRQPHRRHPAGHDLGGSLGRPGERRDVVPPLRRLARCPGEAVPGRPRRDLGRRHHQHRPQLPRRRARLLRRAGAALRRRPARLRELPGAQARQRHDRTTARQGQGAPVPPPGARALSRAPSTASTASARSRPPTPTSSRARSRSPTAGRSGTGSRC